MKLVFIVMKNSDFTEGRGPMFTHLVFSTFDQAEKYVLAQEGIYGSPQGRSSYGGSSPDSVSYNGYSIDTHRVVSTAAEMLEKEHLKARAEILARSKEVKAKALSKLSYEEREILGLN